MKRVIYFGLLSLSGPTGALFFFGALHFVLSHYLYFDPNKIAVEFETSMIVAGAHLSIAVVSSVVFAILWRRFQRLGAA